MKVELSVAEGRTVIKLIPESEFEKTILANRLDGKVDVVFEKKAKSYQWETQLLDSLRISFYSKIVEDTISALEQLQSDNPLVFMKQ